MLDRSKIDAMRSQLKEGVQVVSAPQLFVTPKDSANNMAAILELRESDRILEPSAGLGNLIDACPTHTVVAIEINTQLCEGLRRKYPTAYVMNKSFLEVDPDGMLGEFDKIIMNPPFAFGADIEHIQHAWKFLKVGGKLASIVCEGPFFRQNKKSQDFRKFLEINNAYIEKLSNGSFKESGTMVNTRMIFMEKKK